MLSSRFGQWPAGTTKLVLTDWALGPLTTLIYGHYLPSSAEEEQLALDELTPREIVVELDKHVIGQKDAKRAVAIALRNRMRRQKLTPELAEEIIPKNIIMIGPTAWERRKSRADWRSWQILRS